MVASAAVDGWDASLTSAEGGGGGGGDAGGGTGPRVSSAAEGRKRARPAARPYGGHVARARTLPFTFTIASLEPLCRAAFRIQCSRVDSHLARRARRDAEARAKAGGCALDRTEAASRNACECVGAGAGGDTGAAGAQLSQSAARRIRIFAQERGAASGTSTGVRPARSLAMTHGLCRLKRKKLAQAALEGDAQSAAICSAQLRGPPTPFPWGRGRAPVPATSRSRRRRSFPTETASGSWEVTELNALYRKIWLYVRETETLQQQASAELNEKAHTYINTAFRDTSNLYIAARERLVDEYEVY
ncbi:glycine, alanine and asparagine-rich protein-like [Schistocerca americana]|uniref:glycine, alanine and asparagine-rich protein-like n=1 Tax=Schistocerca americana TaxID=7009 RepID=UPI001F4F477C|nr:glycine, alanine and asparagine-rich protein-like [Schistocerca americana]